MTMMGKDGQHVKESSPASVSSTSQQPGQDEPHTHQHLPSASSSSSPSEQHQVAAPPVGMALPEQSLMSPPPWSHMTAAGQVTSHVISQQHGAPMFTVSTRQRLVPPPPIPNIIVDPVPARDSFGHSRTPPFVPSPSEWGMGASSAPAWSLMIPGLGKKPRAHSDSSIIGLEREQPTHTYSHHPPASAIGIPMRGPEGSTGGSVFQFEEARVPPPSGGHDSRRLTVPFLAVTGPEPSAASHTAAVPMETDRPSISPQTVQEGDTEEHGGEAAMSPPERSAQDKPSVPFIWHFQSQKGFEKSPKTYWLRRHSDSNLPESEPQDLSSSGAAAGGRRLGEPSAAQLSVSSIRSHSTGDTEAPQPRPEITLRGRSEGDTPLPSPLPPTLPHPSDSPELHSPTGGPSPFEGLGRREEGVVSKRLKLKKYLQKRYQLSLKRVRQLSDTDDVFSDRGPETPSPGFLAASQGFTYTPPSTVGSCSSRTESSSLETEEGDTESGQAAAARVEEARAPSMVESSPVRRPRLSLKETVAIKTEPISPCESEGEPETPVFASPLFPPVRGHSESPRWQGAPSVFQFHAPARRSHSPPCVSEPMALGSRNGSGQRSPPEAAAAVATSGTISSMTPLSVSVSQVSPPVVTWSREEVERRVLPTTETGREASERVTGGHSSPLPPFSTMLQRPPLSHSAQLVPTYTHAPPPPPFVSYTQPPPISSAPATAMGAPPWAPGPPVSVAPPPAATHSSPTGPATASIPQYTLAEHYAHRGPSLPTSPSRPSPPGPSSSSGGGGGGGGKGEPSKIIYCPFSEKVQEQRHSRDPNTTFMCPVCGQVFPSYNYLANHMVNHLPSEVVTKGPGDSNKIHLCKVCNRAFSRSDMLTRHMRLHTGLRPYECRICGQVFSRSDHLHTHLRTHTGEKPYKCPQCPYAAPRRDMITRHMRIHMKQFSRRGRRSSSVSSETVSSDLTGGSQGDVKRRNQSLSSVESQDSTESPFRRSSTASEIPEMDSPQAKSRSWSLTSGEIMEGPELSSRHWSATSMESTESYPSPRDHSPRGRHYFSFHHGGTSAESSSSGEGALSLHLPPSGGLWGAGRGVSIEEGMEQESSSPSPGGGGGGGGGSGPLSKQALSPGSDSLSAEMQSSFQKCKVTSDKDSTSSSGSDKDTTMSPSRSGGATSQTVPESATRGQQESSSKPTPEGAPKSGPETT